MSDIAWGANLQGRRKRADDNNRNHSQRFLSPPSSSSVPTENRHRHRQNKHSYDNTYINNNNNNNSSSSPIVNPPFYIAVNPAVSGPVDPSIASRHPNIGRSPFPGVPCMGTCTCLCGCQEAVPGWRRACEDCQNGVHDRLRPRAVPVPVRVPVRVPVPVPVPRPTRRSLARRSPEPDLMKTLRW